MTGVLTDVDAGTYSEIVGEDGKRLFLVVDERTERRDVEGATLVVERALEAGQQPVTSLSELSARIDEAREAGRKSILVLIRRAGEPRFVALPIDEAE